MRPKAFTDLWSLAESLAKTHRGPFGSPRDARSVFDCSAVGLILNPGDSQAFYESTPTNSDTFANTGGDGVHYGFLQLPDRAPDDYPVVMTVPTAEHQNFILGDNLIEFLRLGCRTGYFWLEQFAYDYNQTVRKVQGAHDFPDNDRGGDLLRHISDCFSLIPWPALLPRLTELRAKHIERLEFDPAKRVAARAAYDEKLKGLIDPFTGKPMS